MILDLGCKQGGEMSCKNNGTCLTNGYCECLPGFKDNTCSTCNFLESKLIKKNKHFSFKVKGCNLGGLLSCENNGTCLSNGYCQCMSGFHGSTCCSCKKYEFFYFKFDRSHWF